MISAQMSINIPNITCWVNSRDFKSERKKEFKTQREKKMLFKLISTRRD